MESAYKSIEDNKDSILSVAGNINSVANVATDLKGEQIDDGSRDLGMIGSDGGSNHQVVTGGNIKKVADDILSVRKAADNIEDIVKVAEGLGNFPTMKGELSELAKQTKDNADRAQTQAEIATAQAESASSSAKTSKVYLDRTIEEGAKAVQAVKDQESLSKQSVVVTGSSEVAKVIAEGDRQVKRVTDTGTAQVGNVATEGTKQVGLVTNTGTAQVKAVQTEGTTQTANAKAQADLATSKAQEATSQATIATTKAQEASGSATLASSKATDASQSAATASSKATEASNSATLAQTHSTLAGNWATKTDGTVNGTEYSAKYHALNAGTKATEASGSASRASASEVKAKTSETLAKNWANKIDGVVADGEYSAKYYAQKAKTDGTEAVNTAKGTALNEISTAKTQSVQAVKTQETTSVGLVQQEGDAQKAKLDTQVIEASNQAKEAKKQADIAKSYANQAATGQVNADWNETATESKAYIKNKPDVYTKSQTYSREEVDAKLVAVFVYKGSVATEANLPSSGVQVGWTYNVEDTGANFAWNGSSWDDLGRTIDLTPYATTANVNAALATKLDTATFNSEKSALQTSIASKLDASTYTTDKPTFATKTDLGTKLNTSVYNVDKATFALKTEVTPKADKTYTDQQLALKADKTAIADMLTKTEAVGKYLGITAKATSAKIADSVAWVNVTGKEKVRTTDTPIKMSDFGGPIDLGMIGE